MLGPDFVNGALDEARRWGDDLAAQRQAYELQMLSFQQLDDMRAQQAWPVQPQFYAAPTAGVPLADPVTPSPPPARETPIFDAAKAANAEAEAQTAQARMDEYVKRLIGTLPPSPEADAIGAHAAWLLGGPTVHVQPTRAARARATGKGLFASPPALRVQPRRAARHDRPATVRPLDTVGGLIGAMVTIVGLVASFGVLAERGPFLLYIVTVTVLGTGLFLIGRAYVDNA
jgi:hypothetical protein